MKTLKSFGFSAFVLLFNLSGVAQQKPDSVTQLQEVVIEQSRLESYAIAHYVLQVDSSTQKLAAFGTVADLMRKNGFGHIRSYGVGGVTTPSFRGTGASHTALLWNGINLQSPLLGQSDFTHIPVTFIDDLQLQSGGTASLYGSGAIGGTVHLKSSGKFNQGLQLSGSSNAGSFGSFFHGGSIIWSGTRFISSTKVFGIQSENNFSYINRNVSPATTEKRQHSEILQHGVLQQNYWRFKTDQVFHFRFWYQNNDIEVPNPTTVNRPSQANQQDKFYRFQAGWKLDRSDLHLSYQASFVRHLLNYNDLTTQLFSKSIFNSFVNSVEAERNFSSKFSITGGLNNTWEKGIVDEYGADSPSRTRTAAFGALKFSNSSKWLSVLSARQELIQWRPVPFVPSLSIESYPNPHLRLFTNVSRNYRVPTFNDLYWKGSGAFGNPNLKSESSWSNEAGLNFHSGEEEKKYISIQAAAFSNLVDDWILWSPTARGWSPDNIKQVWARGVESNFRISIPAGPVKTRFKVLYTFTRSTNRAVYDGSVNGELNKQLIFTPQHEGSFSAQLAWKKTSLNLIHSYTGKQYTDGDNNEFFAMKSYQVLNVWLTQQFVVGKIHSLVQFEINNVLDSDYQARPGYPLPGRNFKLALTIQFNKPIKQ